MTTRITHYRHDETGELIPSVVMGETEDCQPVYLDKEDWTPVDAKGRVVAVLSDGVCMVERPECPW